MFRDITTVFQDADGLQLAIDSMQELIKDLDFDVIVGAESRGFIYGAALAYNLHKPLVLIRKKGKLPWKTISVDYDLEYGKATLEMHIDAIQPGQKWWMTFWRPAELRRLWRSSLRNWAAKLSTCFS